jgi:hypothetical protein
VSREAKEKKREKSKSPLLLFFCLFSSNTLKFMVMYLMLISYMTQMMVMFSVIILVGLLLTWINDGLEHLFTRLRFTRLSPSETTKGQTIRAVPSLQSRELAMSSVTKQATVRMISIPKPIPITVSPEVTHPKHHDYASKIVKIDLAPRSRASQDETGERLGEHVKVHLPKAA